MISVVNRLNIVKVSSLSPLWVVIELDPQLYHFQREMWPGGGGEGRKTLRNSSDRGMVKGFLWV